eukprot:comp20233_c0_seq1/m.25225 comp20233_c0_seq1/g.25225  ORF comp20233_c0_seq1/g.25225 comp20233_c0_seq1/m.25225 type:complete len:307 (-) comp20233_c0_seq1:93-1013(-)
MTHLTSAVLTLQEPSSLVVITDSVDTHTNQIRLLRASVENALEKGFKVVCFTFDTLAATFQAALRPDLASRAKIIDAFLDPLGWDSGNPEGGWDVEKIIDHVRKIVSGTPSEGKGTVVFVDAISMLLLRTHVDKMCRALRTLAREPGVTRVITSLHSDLHDTATCSALTHLASTHIHLDQTTQTGGNSWDGECTVLHRKKTGKVTRTRELYHVDARNKLESRPLEGPNKVAAPKDPQADPTANLTFNLSLTGQQKDARAQLVLPYMHSQKTQKALLGGGAGRGQIHYQPDEGDDVDDEDPDDDLDI